MKIIFGESLDAIADHARKVVAKSQQVNDSPHGVAHHSAKVPQTCEDCGLTFWHGSDPYAWYPHLGCKGAKVKDAGF